MNSLFLLNLLMKKILIIGGGAMGSAFSVPCIDNNHKVFITEQYSQRFIKNLSSKNKFHSSLKINLSKKLIFKKYAKELFLEKYDLIVVALSLSGINFIGKELNNYKVKSPILILTKGLKYDKRNKKITTISQTLLKNYPKFNLGKLFKRVCEMVIIFLFCFSYLRPFVSTKIGDFTLNFFNSFVIKSIPVKLNAITIRSYFS